MRIVIVAPGAVGGYFGGLLAKAGEIVGALARGAHLAAIREGGLRIEGPEAEDRGAARGEPTTRRSLVSQAEFSSDSRSSSTRRVLRRS